MNATEVTAFVSTDIYRKLVIFMLISILSIVLNLAALLAVIKKERDSSFFIHHIFISSLVTQFTFILVILESLNVITINGDPLCGLYTFWKKLAGGVTLLTVVGLSYERLKLPGLHSGNFSKRKVVMMTWGLASLLAVPSFFTSQTFVPKEGKAYCRKQPLFGSIIGKLIYDGTVCLFLHVIPSIFILYYLFRINFKIEYLVAHETYPPALKKKLHRVQLMFWYSIIYVVFVLPLGIIHFAKQIVEASEGFKKAEKFKVSHSNTLFTILDLFKAFSCYKEKVNQHDGVNCRFKTSVGRFETVGVFSGENSDNC